VSLNYMSTKLGQVQDDKLCFGPDIFKEPV
jgi:hypothetical protein